ncbi:MAG TPA: phenylacetate-CoA oxygenase subunit PaaJ [Acidobacteriota bacterium]|jgi:ring-1,2-phenylacetyl-CoA epoxidase subunit PaaD|nr:phenylacetate-CoA oxygenase subunit PaaJ [Acidobacteriota bacterium]
MGALTENAVWKILADINDPEIPVISIVELGVVRKVRINGHKALIEMTPTFSACPAYHAMQTSIEERLREIGAEQVEIRTVLTPPWSTDALSDETREKLRRSGLAVPDRHGGDAQRVLDAGAAVCPYCGSDRTRQTNPFGCTPCRSIAFCEDCRQPFEQLKPL